MCLKVEVQAEVLELARIAVVRDGYRDGPEWDWHYEAVRTAWPVALGALRDHLAQAGWQCR